MRTCKIAKGKTQTRNRRSENNYFERNITIFKTILAFRKENVRRPRDLLYKYFCLLVFCDKVL